MHLSVFLKLGGTQSEPLGTRLEPNSTQRVVPSRIEHSSTSPKQEDINNQDQSSLANHSGLLMRGTKSPGLDREE
jgi:hypothetical protein